MRPPGPDRRRTRGVAAWLALLALWTHAVLPGTMPSGVFGDGFVICAADGPARGGTGGGPAEEAPSEAQHCMLCRFAAAPVVLPPPGGAPAPPGSAFAVPSASVPAGILPARIVSPLQPRAPPAIS